MMKNENAESKTDVTKTIPDPEVLYRETLEREALVKRKLADDIFKDAGPPPMPKPRRNKPDGTDNKDYNARHRKTNTTESREHEDPNHGPQNQDSLTQQPQNQDNPAAKHHEAKKTGGKRKKTSRKAKRRKKKKSFLGRFFGFLAILFLLTLTCGVAGVFGGNYLFEKKTGHSILDCAIDAKKTVLASTDAEFVLNKTTRIYSESGITIAKLAMGAKENHLGYHEIPKNVINAFVAVEDRSFWENPGFDIKGMIRVVVNYFISSGGEAHGASTITQQLARTVFLSTEKSIERKVREIFISYYLTQKYSKEQIMEYYINNCCFANNIYGIRDAARTYFDKEVSELSLSETAYLCAIPNRPQYYDPLQDSTRAISRRDKILKDMMDCGFISQNQYTKAKAEEIVINQNTSSEDQIYNYPTTYAVNCVIEYLMEQKGFQFQYHFKTKKAYKEYLKAYQEMYDLTERDLYTGGYEIQTSLDLDATKKLQKVLDDTLDFNDDVDEATGIYELQGAITVIDNDTGKVTAVIGGRSQKKIKNTYSLNRTFQVTRQPGSTIKPLVVYAPAFDNELAVPSTALKNIDVSYAYDHPEKIQKQRGRSIRLRSAVEQSLNGCALYLFNQVTPSVGLSYLENMGFSHIVPDDYYLSAGLGGLTYGTNTDEMANAYYTLEQHGKYTNTNCIKSILDYNGTELYVPPEETKVYKRTAADTMTDVLQGVLVRGTGASMHWRADSHGMTAAGKTGTTNDMKDGWFCGYSPYYTIAVWVGRDDNKKVHSLYGNTYPGTIWKESMLIMNGDRYTVNFDLEPMSD